GGSAAGRGIEAWVRKFGGKAQLGWQLRERPYSRLPGREVATALPLSGTAIDGLSEAVTVGQIFRYSMSSSTRQPSRSEFVPRSCTAWHRVSRVLIRDYRSCDEFLSLKQKTQCDYGRLLNVFAPIGHHPADSVRRRHIRELSKTFACEARTQQLFGQVASLLFNFGVGNDYVETNPALRMKCMDRPRA